MDNLTWPLVERWPQEKVIAKGRAGYRRTEKFRRLETLLEKRMVEWFLATHLKAKSIVFIWGSLRTLLTLNQQLVAGRVSVLLHAGDWRIGRSDSP